MIKKERPESQICVYVQDIAVEVRIGLHPWEQKPQPLVVNVALYADAVSSLSNVSTKSIINYERVHKAIQEWPGRPHVGLIETYIRELLDIGFSFEKVESMRASIMKADVFPDAKGAGVEVFMTREDYKKI